eukprot:gene11227-biopygen4707
MQVHARFGQAGVHHRVVAPGSGGRRLRLWTWSTATDWEMHVVQWVGRAGVVIPVNDE